MSVIQRIKTIILRLGILVGYMIFIAVLILVPYFIIKGLFLLVFKIILQSNVELANKIFDRLAILIGISILITTPLQWDWIKKWETPRYFGPINLFILLWACLIGIWGLIKSAINGIYLF